MSQYKIQTHVVIKMTESKELSVKEMFAGTLGMAFDVFKLRLLLKQDTEAWYSMLRSHFQKRLRITYFADDGTGEVFFELKYKHWWYIPYYFFFRDRKRILAETSIIIAEEYLFALTGRKVRKGYTGFAYGRQQV